MDQPNQNRAFLTEVLRHKMRGRNETQAVNQKDTIPLAYAQTHAQLAT